MTTFGNRQNEVLNHLNILLRRAQHLDNKIKQTPDMRGLSYDRSELATLKYCITLAEREYEKETYTAQGRERCQSYFEGTEAPWASGNK